MARMSGLIISYAPPYNRQGRDLCVTLKQYGYDITLFQKDDEMNEANNIYGIKCLVPKGEFP